MRVLMYNEGQVNSSIDVGSNTYPLDDAFDRLFTGSLQFIDLEDSETRTLLQVALFGDNRYLIQIFLGGEADESPGLFCARNGVPHETALTCAKQFATTGTYDESLFPFSSPPEEEISRPLPLRAKYIRLSRETELKRKIEKEPQNYLNSILDKYNYQAYLANIQYAIELGASLKRCKPYPPLVYHALKLGDSEAIPFFISLGCDVNEVHAGRSIIWHAITNHMFAYASTLALHGAAIDTAQSSPKYQKWEVYEAEQRIFRAIESGDNGLLGQLIQPLSRNRIKLDWLKQAVVCNQFDSFQMLLDKKGKVRLETVTPISVYAKALAKEDTRYLAGLIQHGAYDSVTDELCPNSIGAGIIFRKASAQCLSYLQRHGYTFGFNEGLKAILESHTWRTESQLDAIDDQLLRELDVIDFLTAVKFLSERGSSERITRLLAGMDNARLLSEVCELGDVYNLSILVQSGAELAAVTSTNLDQRSVRCRQFIKQTRRTLIELLEELATA